MEIITKVPGFKPGMKLSDIHGHVCIDLHNHNSGFTERIEADNVVTQAINKMLPLAAAADAWNNFFPIALKALGGIMLFDASLGNYSTESTDITLPSSAHLMGFAGQDTNTEEPFQGSYNSGESGEITGGYRSVWDFATNQGNGTIGAIARTHKDVSYGPGRVIFGRNIADWVYRSAIINRDESNDLFYQQQQNGTNVVVSKHKTDDLKVADSFPNACTDVQTISSILSYNKPLRPRADDQCGFYFYNSTYEQVYAYRLYKVDFTDLSDVTETSQWSRVYDGQLNTNVYGFTYNHGYLLTSDGSKLVKVALSNGDIISTIDLPVSDIDFSMMANRHDVMYLFGYGTGHALLYPDGVIKYFTTKEIAKMDAAIGLDGVIYVPGNHVSCGALPYLGSVANLGSAVVKTASQSMKVTYTLTDQ